jgi:transposase
MAKRLKQGGFKWPGSRDGVMRLTAAQLSALLEALDSPDAWQAPQFAA